MAHNINRCFHNACLLILLLGSPIVESKDCNGKHLDGKASCKNICNEFFPNKSYISLHIDNIDDNGKVVCVCYVKRAVVIYDRENRTKEEIVNYHLEKEP